ncbi:tyrosine-protein kinase involved in EPS biosynthesis [Caballeronia fortuita]|uniref:Putative tyrosine-protein kinase EpsB n=1 Tax=Caballeronia fortuita TaxID=1777138 RepID=A0A157Z172_9BURK|nr:polysaccharide biosynthesis tyrosine autokinase [Caballeronia fortuita]SAK39276.1 tyrosine-protein kinase involved in EPS biosynthesis [Caballeronia fortuita]
MSQENTTARKPSEDEYLNFIALLDALFDNKKLIAAIVALALAVGGLYVLLAQPVFNSSIVVAVEDSSDASTARNLIGDVSAMFDVKSSADGEIQILGSRLVASKAVDALKLNVEARPRYFPVVGRWIASHADGVSNPGLFGWGGFAWGSESIRVSSFDVPRNLQGRRFELVALPDHRYQLSGDGLNEPVVGTIGKTEQFQTAFGPISLNVVGIAARPGVAFVLLCRSRQITTTDLVTSLRIQEQGKRSGVIAAALEGTDPVLLSQTLNEIGRQYVQQNADRKAAQAARSIEFLDAQLPLMKQRLENAEASLSQYENQHTVVDLSEAGKVVLRQSAEANTQLAALQQKRQELATRFGPAHPALLAIDSQISAEKEQINQIAGQIQEMPLTEQDLLKLQRDVRVSSDLYILMRSNVEQLRLVKAGKIGNVRLVDAADVPELPVKPRKLMILAGSVVMGLFLGALVAILKDRLFTGVTDPAVLEERTGLHVFATIPFSEQQQEMSRRSASKSARMSVLAVVRPNDPAMESLRSLHTAIKFALPDAANNVVLITGPTPGMGKSFVSVNLAAILASSGKRVLLIDGDMRKGYVNRYFDLDRSNGLAEAIASSRPLATVTHRGVLPNLDLVTTGKLPPNPSALLHGTNWSDLIASASKDYDLVIIDAPPLLAVSDSEAISSAAGTVFLVTRFGKTRSGDVIEAERRLAQAGSKVTGILFNSMKPRSGIYGGRYQAYRYVDYNYHDDRAD